jgi:uncharacterized membrane protein
MNARLPKLVFGVMVICAAIHFSSYYSQLPAVVASHFDVHGAANGWQTKQAFFVVFAAVTILAAILVFALPELIAIVPRQFVNLPNKEYWLSPERLAASHQFLSAWFAWYGCAVYGVIFVAFDYAVKSNLGLAARPDPALLWYGLAAFGAFTLIWIIRLTLRFARVPTVPGMQS